MRLFNLHMEIELVQLSKNSDQQKFCWAIWLSAFILPVEHIDVKIFIKQDPSPRLKYTWFYSIKYDNETVFF